jgi:hypothetical protein
LRWLKAYFTWIIGNRLQCIIQLFLENQLITGNLPALRKGIFSTKNTWIHMAAGSRDDRQDCCHMGSVNGTPHHSHWTKNRSSDRRRNFLTAEKPCQRGGRFFSPVRSD